MSECKHKTVRLVKSNTGTIASACSDCIADDDLTREGYSNLNLVEVEHVMRTHKSEPPMLNPLWFKT